MKNNVLIGLCLYVFSCFPGNIYMAHVVSVCLFILFLNVSYCSVSGGNTETTLLDSGKIEYILTGLKTKYLKISQNIS